MDLEIESLLFKQVEKPRHFLMIRVINVFENRYRVNLYIEIEENNLIKRKIAASYFCHYSPGKLAIIPEPDYKSPELKRKQRL
jgi:hypothetical protein